MRLVLLLVLLCVNMFAADLTVCASGCDYTSPWTAITAANPGDTVTLQAGERFNPGVYTLPIKPGSRWITVRSSAFAMLPDGQRPVKDDARLATIAFTDNNAQITLPATYSATTSTCWTSQLVDQTVTVGYTHSSTNPCEARLQDGTLYHSEAPIGTITFLGGTLTYAGTAYDQGTGLRVGLGNDGLLHISHRSDIVYGTHFTCTNCVAVGEKDSWVHYSFPTNTIPLTNIAYTTAGVATAVSNRRVFLSGPQAAKTNLRGLYAGTYEDTYKGGPQGVHHYRFQGIQFEYESLTPRTYGTIFLYATSNNDYRNVPHHIEFDRCVFSHPKALQYYWGFVRIYHGEHILLKDVEMTQFNTDTAVVETQPFLVLGSDGPFVLDNVHIPGGTENLLIGGSNTGLVGLPTVRVRRSFFEKYLEQRPSLRVVRQSSTYLLALTGTDSSTRCNATTCIGYYNGVAYTYSLNSLITASNAVSTKVYIGVSPTGVLTVGHNGGSDITCSGSFTCLAGVTSRTSMASYAIIYEWTVANAEWSSTYDWYFGRFYHKNLFEFKQGYADVAGCLFGNYWAGAQTLAITFTPRNQNGQDAFVGIDGINFFRNKLYNAHSGVSAIGYDDMGWNTFGRGYRFAHNVFLNLNKASYGNTTAGGEGFAFGDGAIDLVLDHNTIQSSIAGFYQNTPSTTLNSVFTSNNIWIWTAADTSYLGAYVGQGLAAGFVNLRKADDAITAYGYVGSKSSYYGNLHISSGTIASTTGWNSWTDSVANSFVGNQRAQSVTFSDHFKTFETPAVFNTTDVRLLSTSPYSKQCVSGCDTQLVTTDGADPGADVDWVDTLTDGVDQGLPELRRRWDVSIGHDSLTQVTVRCVVNGTMTLKVSTHSNMLADNLVYNTSIPTSDVGGFKSWVVTGLTAGVRYWYTLTDGVKTVKGRL